MASTRIFLSIWFSLYLGLLTSCATAPTQAVRPEAIAQAQTTATSLEIVETVPVETSLNHPDLQATHTAWMALINSAQKQIDVAQFYTSNEPESRLSRVMNALREAAGRGVQIRFLVDGKFSDKYPETLDELKSIPTLKLRVFHVEPIMGGILHAKYFVVDRKQAFLGSQNFDWRSLEHIHELGVLIRGDLTVRAIQAIFDTDWHLAAGAQQIPSVSMAQNFPAKATIGGQEVSITPVFSPKGWLPDPELWDLPRLIALIDAAQNKIQVQLLSFKTHGYHGEDFPDLMDALLKAGERGVEVQVMVSHWNTGYKNLPALRTLHAHPKITVTIATIPEASSGFIPFARVIHAKYMVVDGMHSWIGTSNWAPGYFYTSRNLGLIVEGAAFAKPLQRVFSDLWEGEYAEELKREGNYPRRKIGP